jgi:hypothetical protein
MIDNKEIPKKRDKFALVRRTKGKTKRASADLNIYSPHTASVTSQ